MATNERKNVSTDTASLVEIIAQADSATTREDLLASQERLRALIEEGFKPSNKAERPYGAALEMTETFRKTYVEPAVTSGVEGAFGDAIGGMTIDAANALGRAERRVKYRLKTLFGFRGLRLVEEGDSWTQYPLILDDIVDQLDENSDIAIYSVGAAGDLVTNMAKQKEYLKALKKTRAKGLLLSGGGNDLFGEFKKMLLRYTAGATPEALIDEPVFQPVFNSVISSFQTILTDVANNHPDVTVFGHGYDLPYPEEKGNWIGPALLGKGIPLDLGRDILRVIMDRFNEALIALADANANFIMCDLRTKVDKGPNSWFDELHPKNAGYSRASAILEKAIRDTLVADGGTESLTMGTAGDFGLSGRLEANLASVKRTIVLDPGHGGTTKVGGSSPNNAVGPNGTLEKTLTLDIAKRTRDFLEGRGFTVMLTRDTDVNLSLTARAAVAKNAKAAAFLSIHFNGFNGKVQGTETFIDKGANAASGAFSLCVQAEMLSALGHKDRNFGKLKYPEKSLGVLNPASHDDGTAVALHEVSFMDVPDEEARLGTVSYRRKIAMALADGIETYLDDAFPGAGLELTDEGFGDAIEIAAAQVGLSSQDLLRVEATMQSDWSESAGPGSVSNGHMLASDSSEAYDADLWALALREARGSSGVESGNLVDIEGNEPDEFDPNVVHVLGAMTANVEVNFNFLKGLFGGGAAVSSPPTPVPAVATSGGFDMNRFIDFIDGLNLTHFSPTELLVLGGSHHGSGEGAGLNTYPPEHLWANIANTAKMLDEIRNRLGVSVVINSAYRSPAYNAAIGGATKSQHMRFNAFDWRAASGTPDQWLAVAEAVRDKDAKSKATFSGWMKRYSTFVHIDTRSATLSLA